MPAPRSSPLLTLLVVAGGAATLAAMLVAWKAQAAPGAPQSLATLGIAAIGVVAGLRCGRLLMSGAFAGNGRCDSCGERRTGSGAFCESCGRRD